MAPKLQFGLNSFCLSTCCHQAKHSSFPTASPLAWLTALCQPSSLVSTSVSTPLLFHSRMLSSFLPLSLYFCLSPLSPSLPPCGDICCCLHGILAPSQTSPPHTPSPHGHLLSSKNSTGQPQYLCVQTYRSSGMQAPQGSGCPVE